MQPLLNLAVASALYFHMQKLNSTAQHLALGSDKAYESLDDYRINKCVFGCVNLR